MPPRARSYVATQFSAVSSSVFVPLTSRAQVQSHVRALFREHRHLTSPALTKIQLEKGQRVRIKKKKKIPSHPGALSLTALYHD